MPETAGPGRRPQQSAQEGAAGRAQADVVARAFTRARGSMRRLAVMLGTVDQWDRAAEVEALVSRIDAIEHAAKRPGVID